MVEISSVVIDCEKVNEKVKSYRDNRQGLGMTKKAHPLPWAEEVRLKTYFDGQWLSNVSCNIQLHSIENLKNEHYDYLITPPPPLPPPPQKIYVWSNHSDGSNNLEETLVSGR